MSRCSLVASRIAHTMRFMRLCLQLPVTRQLTKWEQYAQTKGIRKHAKSKLVYDEQEKVRGWTFVGGDYVHARCGRSGKEDVETGLGLQDWKPRYGYRRGNDKTKDWMIEIPDHKGTVYC